MNTEKNPIDQHLDNILKASGTTLGSFETSAGALQAMRAALLAAVAELAPARAASANHFPGAAKMVVELSDAEIEAILLACGYTIRPGLKGLKRYAIDGARALIAADRALRPAAPFNVAEWHDATWKAMRLRAMSDAMIAPMNIHTIRAFCDASFAALAENSGIPSHPAAAPQPPAAQPVAPVSDLNALMGLVDTYAYLRSDADICMTPEVAQELEDKAKVGRSVLLAALSAKDAAHAQQQAVSDQLIRNLEARNAGLATDLAAARQHLPAHAPAFGTVAAGKLAELQANGFAVNGVSIEKTEVTGQVTRGFVTYGGLVGWWSLGAGVQSGPVLLTDDALVEINLHVAMNEVADSDGSREIVIKHGRSIEAAVHAANQAPANLEWSKGGEITKIDERVQRSRAAFYALQKDAERYRLVRRGQHWSVIDGAGDALRAEELDVAADAVISKAAGQEGGAA